MQLLHRRLHLLIFYVQVLEMGVRVHRQILHLNLVVEIQEVCFLFHLVQLVLNLLQNKEKQFYRLNLQDHLDLFLLDHLVVHLHQILLLLKLLLKILNYYLDHHNHKQLD